MVRRMIDWTALIRGGTAGMAIFATLLTIAALLYTGRVKKIEENADDNILMLTSMARGLRWLVVLNTAVLVYLSTAYSLRFFYALPRPRLEPTFVFWMNLGSFFIPTLLTALPAVILISLVIRIKQERGQKLADHVLSRLFKKRRRHD